jgi:hypothetical protein
MTPKEFAKFLDRDRHQCWHCGRSGDDLVPQHRISRGMGGSKSKIRNGSANILVFCSEANGLIESDPQLAKQARMMGWKLGSYRDPARSPAFNIADGIWYVLDENFGRVLAPLDLLNLSDYRQGS